MARARLKHTGKALGRRGNPPKQPTCRKCGEPIEPGEDRYEWSFRYGGTYTQHAHHGAPRLSETTQGSVSQLYAAQEAIDDALAADRADFTSWRDNVASALNDAADTADEMQQEYEAAAEPFGGAGPNQERAEACESWAEELRNAAEEVEGFEVEEVDEVEELTEPASHDDRVAHEEAVDAYDTAVQDAEEAAQGEVESAAEGASGNLEL